MHQRIDSRVVRAAVFDSEKLRLPEVSNLGSVMIKQPGEPTLIRLTPSSGAERDVCAERAICRLAAKLGCRFCIA